MKKGFTLIEILVVVAIIAILTTIIIVSVEQTQKKARDARRVSHIKDIQKMLIAYQSSTGSLPEGIVNEWEWGCSYEHDDCGDFLQVLVNESITKFVYKESKEGYGYRYGYFDNVDCDGDANSDIVGVLYTPCESKKCPTGEVMSSCPGWNGIGKENDESSYIIFIKEN